MIDAARCEAIQHWATSPRYEAMRCALHRRFTQPVAAMQRDERGKRPIAIRLCKKRLTAVAGMSFWDVPAFANSVPKS